MDIGYTQGWGLRTIEKFQCIIDTIYILYLGSWFYHGYRPVQATNYDISYNNRYSRCIIFFFNSELNYRHFVVSGGTGA